MTKLLDLDKLETTTEYAITLKGVKHQMKAVSVGDYINLTKLQEGFEGASMVEQVETALKMIMIAFPSVTEEVGRGLNFDQMSAIVNFIMTDSSSSEDASAKPAKDGEASGN